MVLRKLVETAVKISKYDKKAWDKLYFGIREDIKLGVRHGLGGGSVVGTFINEGVEGPNAGTIPFKNVHETYKPNKTRSGRSNKYSSKYTNSCRPVKRRGQSYSRYSNRVRYW